MPKVLKTTETPNPQARRFYLDVPVWGQGSRDFPTVEMAQDHPLAAKLFELPYVTAVFFLGTSVTVSKDAEAGWEELISPIADCLESFQDKGLSFVETPKLVVATAASVEIGSYAALDSDAQHALVQSILNEFVRPGLQSDGGDLELVDCDSHNIVVRYAGACGTCPTSSTGTLGFIETVMREKIHSGLDVHLAS